MISCIIIEDQLPARKILKKYIRNTAVLELKGVFSSALVALEYLKENPVELLFLDIHLPKLSGIDFLNLINIKPFVILTTAFPDYAVKSYELDIVDYLLKPFSFERFLKAVLKVERLMKNPDTQNTQKKPESILVKVGYDFVKIPHNELSYIKADGDYTQIFSKGKKYHTSNPLRHWKNILPGEQFIQVHRSYIVNIDDVKKISTSSIMINNTLIPVGRNYKKEFQSIYLNLSRNDN